MDPDFWHARWEANQIGFHRDEINVYLERYWPALGLDPGSRVLAPLCGKSLDLLWLREQGHMVTGIELSRIAVQAFFEETESSPLYRSKGTSPAGHARALNYCAATSSTSRQPISARWMPCMTAQR